jgi:hypothetical protein
MTQAVRELLARKAWRNLCLEAGVGQMICRGCETALTGHKCDACGSRNPKYAGLIFHDLRAPRPGISVAPA